MFVSGSETDKILCKTVYVLNHEKWLGAVDSIYDVGLSPILSFELITENKILINYQQKS